LIVEMYAGSGSLEISLAELLVEQEGNDAAEEAIRLLNARLGP
jgi:hypothetical protein